MECDILRIGIGNMDSVKKDVKLFETFGVWTWRQMKDNVLGEQNEKRRSVEESRRKAVPSLRDFRVVD